MLRSVALLILCAACLNVASACTSYTVQAGDNSWAIVNKNCPNGQNGCTVGAEQYPATKKVANGKVEWCPASLFVGEVIELCCEEPNPTPSACENHVVTSNDNSWQLTFDKCGVGCTTDAVAYPAVRRKRADGGYDFCPYLIFDGETVEVCCSDPGSSTPKPTSATPSVSPTPAPTNPPGSTCPYVRDVQQGDTVFFTIDDGPSFTSREYLLDALDSPDFKISFFDSGYNVCNDSSKAACAFWAYDKNAKNLADTVKRGHFLAAHSDFHYYDASQGICSYLTTPPDVRPESRLQECGSEPIQDMVQGAHQLEQALNYVTDWAGSEDLKAKAIDNIWNYARLPCSDIWRTRGNINLTNLPGVSNQAEIALRTSIADDMFSGNVKCRPAKYTGPWEIYGFDSNVEWFGGTILNPGEKCRMVKLIEDNIENESNPDLKGKLVLLTHDYHFNSQAKAQVFREVVDEIRAKGYKVDTIDNFH